MTKIGGKANPEYQSRSVGIVSGRSFNSSAKDENCVPRHPEMDASRSWNYESRFRAYKVCWESDEIILFDGVKIPRLERYQLENCGIKVREASPIKV